MLHIIQALSEKIEIKTRQKWSDKILKTNHWVNLNSVFVDEINTEF